MTTTLAKQVMAFHARFGHPVRVRPTVPPDEEIRFRLKLIAEEFLEVLDACGARTESLGDLLRLTIEGTRIEVDLPALVDGLGDLDFVSEGTRCVLGVDGKPVAARIAAANLAKDPVYVAAKDEHHRSPDPLAKPTKPPGWEPPDVEAELLLQGRRREDRRIVEEDKDPAPPRSDNDRARLDADRTAKPKTRIVSSPKGSPDFEGDDTKTYARTVYVPPGDTYVAEDGTRIPLTKHTPEELMADKATNPSGLSEHEKADAARVAGRMPAPVPSEATDNREGDRTDGEQGKRIDEADHGLHREAERTARHDPAGGARVLRGDRRGLGAADRGAESREVISAEATACTHGAYNFDGSCCTCGAQEDKDSLT